MESYKLASRQFRPEGTSFNVKDVTIGGKELVMMAGPCAVESEEQVEAVASKMAACGVKVLRGGAYKPRTSPYAFQGLEKEGLKILRRVADRYGLLVISEITSENDIEYASNYLDMLFCMLCTENMTQIIWIGEDAEKAVQESFPDYDGSGSLTYTTRVSRKVHIVPPLTEWMPISFLSRLLL